MTMNERCIKRLEKEISKLEKVLPKIKDIDTLNGTERKLEEYVHILAVFTATVEATSKNSK